MLHSFSDTKANIDSNKTNVESANNDIERYKIFILQQKELVNQIHQQQKKLKKYHNSQSRIDSLNTSIQSNTIMSSFMPDRSTSSKKHKHHLIKNLPFGSYLNWEPLNHLHKSSSTLIPTCSNLYQTKPLGVNLSYKKCPLNQSELLKTQIKKEALLTEIELLENQIKLKRHDLKTSQNLNDEYDLATCSNRLNCSMDANNNNNNSKLNCLQNCTLNNDQQKSPFSYDEVLKLMNERDILKHKLYFDKSYKEVERKELENQLAQAREELAKEQKYSKDKIARLEEESKNTRCRLDETMNEKEELNAKLKSLENKLFNLQQDLNKKDRDAYNTIIAENTEKHLTSLCQTLTSQLEDVKLQLRLSDDKCKRLEYEQITKFEKLESYTTQIECLKKELDSNNDSFQRMKRTYEEQISSHLIKEKEINEVNIRLLKEREEEIFDLKSQLNDAKNIKINNQQLHDALIHDFKKTISKQDEDIRNLEEALRLKSAQFEQFQREFEFAIGPKVEERIKYEKSIWEQEQNALIRRELAKLSEEKCKELAKLQEELNAEREKHNSDREKCIKLENEIEDLNQELKQANKDRANALVKAKESLRNEIEKVKADAYLEKQEELNRYKRMIKDTEEEVDRLKAEQHQFMEKEREFIFNVEKLEKNLIKDLNDEQRKLSSFIPGLVPKFVNYSNLRSIYAAMNAENALNLNTFQTAFSNLKALLEEVTQNYQNLKAENDQSKRNMAKVVQDNEENIENIKRQYEKQKQKELETIREYITKDQDSLNNYTNEISSLVSALKNKDREIQEIQENMVGWKKETLTKLADKFEVELNKELDRRMHEYKIESNNQQMQLDKIRKEMDNLLKEYRNSSQNQISQEQHERMVRYLQSRLNDLRDENLGLRERIKTSNIYIQPPLSQSKTFSEQEFQNLCNGTCTGQSKQNLDDDNVTASLYTPSIDGDDQLESKNELLQQKLNELQKLQMQLNNVQS